VRNVRTIDAGIRDVVVLLNHIPGVLTRASCEGTALTRGRHRHADLAYVLFRYPLPLRLQEFLIDALGELARVDDDGLYSRWPTHNAAFLARLAQVVRNYGSQPDGGRCYSAQWRLAKLRSQLARVVCDHEPARLGLCLQCANLFLLPHIAGHASITLLDLAADQEGRWLESFIKQPQNVLDADLVALSGWEQLAARSQRGDFGDAFHRRWLRYRARMIAALATTDLRTGVQSARRAGKDLDCYYDAARVVLQWRDD